MGMEIGWRLGVEFLGCAGFGCIELVRLDRMLD
jgi:hypothetical protein